jgi:hypothetical protein
LIGLTLLIVGVGISIIVIILFTFDNKAKASFSTASKVDCSGDGFKSVKFNDSTGSEVYLKFMAFEKETQVYQLYNFPEAVEECKAKNATLWQVILGQEEWEAIIEPLKKVSRDKIWIHGKMEEDCSDGEAEVNNV